MKAWVIADSDSNLKWGIARAADLALVADVDVMVIDSAVAPSPQQQKEAVAGRWSAVTQVNWMGVRRLCRREGADIVLLACRGPMVEFLLREVWPHAATRPVIVAGIPGVWWPPTLRGIDFRRGCDVIVTHSVRERERVREMVSPSTDVGLASLTRAPTPSPNRGVGAVVFAPQALVPRTRPERVHLLEALTAAAHRHPHVPFIIKVRGGAGERQTHDEFASYEELVRDSGTATPPNLVFARGPLHDFLGGARALVTVSSTAALEAMAARVPTLVLDDFGVSDQNLNTVFVGSGCIGSTGALDELAFGTVDPAWMRDNYFHAATEDDWVAIAVRRTLPRATRPALHEGPRGVRGVVRRMRVRAQALGSADRWTRRTASALIVGPAMVVRNRLHRSERTA